MKKSEQQAYSNRGHSRLTKREYFSLEMMKVNIVAEMNTSVETACECLNIKEEDFIGIVHFNQYLAKLSVSMADILLNELEKK